jgi:flagellar hook-associated protein 1 FlgK
VSDLGIDIAASGLAAQQTLLDTASQNLANVSTPGYAQETANLSAAPSGSPDGVGDGVLIGATTSQTSALYEALSNAAAGQLGAANSAASVQSAAQEAFPEPSTTGLSSQLDQLFSGLSALATEPNSQAAAATVVNDAAQVATTFNNTYNQLATTSGQLVSQLQGSSGSQGLVSQANQLIGQIAQLNGEIYDTPGQAASSLVDQRRAAVSQLAGLLGVNATPQGDGSVTVSLNGVQLVSGTTATDLETAPGSGGRSIQLQTAMPTPVTVTAGGSVGALITGINTTIPSYQSQLSGVADALANALNTLQSGGVSASGTPGPTSAAASGWTGSLLPANLFVNAGSSSTYTPGSTSAASIAVNPALTADPSQLATASGGSTAGQATIDPTTVQAMAALGQQTGGPLSLYQSLVGLVGNQTQQANNDQTGAQALSDTANANLSSVEGVDSNEQTVDVMAAQNAYQATAGVINAINQSLQSLLEVV